MMPASPVNANESSELCVNNACAVEQRIALVLEAVSLVYEPVEDGGGLGMRGAADDAVRPSGADPAAEWHQQPPLQQVTQDKGDPRHGDALPAQRRLHRQLGQVELRSFAQGGVAERDASFGKPLRPLLGRRAPLRGIRGMQQVLAL